MRRWAQAVAASIMVAAAAPAAAGEHDALDPLPIRPMMGRPYPGAGEPAEIDFINMRDEPVRILWIDFTGTPRLYKVLESGDDYVQPTFVSHRWLIESGRTGEPREGFIATRSTVGNSPAQLAIIR